MGNALPNQIHRAFRYAKDYSAFQGKDLSKKTDMVPGGCYELWKTYQDWESHQPPPAAK
jgi:hypothetical protein